MSIRHCAAQFISYDQLTQVAKNLTMLSSIQRNYQKIYFKHEDLNVPYINTAQWKHITYKSTASTNLHERAVYISAK